MLYNDVFNSTSLTMYGYFLDDTYSPNILKFDLVERRRKVASLLGQSMTETEIAKELGVDQSTISRGIKVLKELPFKKWFCDIENILD